MATSDLRYNGVVYTHSLILLCQEEFEDIKGVIRICKLKKDRQHNGQKKKDKQLSTKHYKEN
jgi:hypothetical protein